MVSRATLAKDAEGQRAAREGVRHRVFVLHGLLGSQENWVPAGKKLVERHPDLELVLVDLRNHGKSFHSPDAGFPHMVDDLLRLREHLLASSDSSQIAHTSVVGHSLGGKAAMFFAMRHPELVSRVAVVDIAPKRYDVEYFRLLFDRMLGLNFAHVQKREDAERHLLAFAEEYAEHLKGAAAVEDELASAQKTLNNLDMIPAQRLAQDVGSKAFRAFVLKNMERSTGGGDNGHAWHWRSNVRGLSEAIDELGGFALPPSTVCTLPATLPALFLRGGASPYVRDADAELIRGLFPNAETVTVPNAGHLVHVSHPGETVATLGEFLAR